MSWTFNWHFDWPSPAAARLEHEWQRAWETSVTSHVFQQPALARIWIDCVARPRGEQAVLLVATDGARTIYLPFTVITQRWNRLWRRDLRALGGDLVFDYQDPLIDGPKMTSAEWETFWFELSLDTRDVGVDSVCISHLSDSTAAVSGQMLIPQRHCWPTTSAPQIDLRDIRSFDAVLARVSRKHRSEINRKLRSVAESNPQLVTFTSDAVADALRMFDEMLVAYDRQRGLNGRHHQFSDPRNVQFFRRIIQEGLLGGWTHVSTFNVEGRPISWHVGFVWKRRFYWYKPCYAIEERHRLPGHLHIAHLLMEGISKDWELFDFTVGTEQYKLSWATAAPPIYRLWWYSSTIRGQFHSATNKVRHAFSAGVSAGASGTAVKSA